MTLNPFHQRAWQYLLRLLGRSPGPEAAPWAERARRLHPANILLALTGARLYPPGEVAGALGRLLDEYAPTLGEEERPAAAAAFAQAIGEAARSADAAGLVDLLERWECGGDGLRPA